MDHIEAPDLFTVADGDRRPDHTDTDSDTVVHGVVVNAAEFAALRRLARAGLIPDLPRAS